MPPDFIEQVAVILAEPEDLSYTTADFQMQELLGYMPEKRSRKPDQVKTVLEQRLQTVSSLDNQVAVGLHTTVDGSFQDVPEAATSEQTQVPRVLEWIRQDNADKGGSNKYRVRETTYYRDPDQTHQKLTPDGWYVATWAEEPSFWSARLRKMVQRISERVAQELPGTKVVFVTEGGVYKGTATKGTDIDTSCYIYGEDEAEFEAAFTKLEALYKEEAAGLEFAIKDNESLRPVFIKKSTGQRYWRDYRNNFAPTSEAPDPDLSHFTYTVRRNEQGVVVTENGKTGLHAKSAESKGLDVIFTITNPDEVTQTRLFATPATESGALTGWESVEA